MLSDPLVDTWELVSAILVTLKDEIKHPVTDPPESVAERHEELLVALDELATAFTELADGDTENAKDRIEAVAGALDPSLLEEDTEAEATDAAPGE